MFSVWQKPMQYCKAVILQLKIDFKSYMWDYKSQYILKDCYQIFSKHNMKLEINYKKKEGKITSK